MIPNGNVASDQTKVYQLASRNLTNWLIQRLFPKHTVTHERLAFGVLLLILMLVIALFGYGLNLALGLHQPDPEALSIFFLGLGYIYVLTIVTDSYQGHFQASFNDYFFDKVSNTTLRKEYSKQFAEVLDSRRQLIFGLLFSLVAHVGFICFAPGLVHVLGWGYLIANFALHIFHGVCIYFFYAAMNWAIRHLSQYEFNLFSLDPSNSEAIGKLSRLLHLGAFLMTCLVALLTTILAIARILPAAAILGAIILMWINTLGLFLVIQFILSSIIARAKWSILNRIQVQITELVSKDEIPTKETLEQVGRLIEYHDRIQARRNSILDLRAMIITLNSLLLPTIGLLVSNYNSIDELLKKLRPLP